jgi:hypothetical protein
MRCLSLALLLTALLALPANVSAGTVRGGHAVTQRPAISRNSVVITLVGFAPGGNQQTTMGEQSQAPGAKGTFTVPASRGGVALPV